MESFTKQSSERYEVAFDFYGRLPPFSGITLSSGTASAYNVTDSVDATATVLQSTTVTISPSNPYLALVGVKAGTSGKTYKITAVITASDTSIFEEDVTMVVTDV